MISSLWHMDNKDVESEKQHKALIYCGEVEKVMSHYFI